MRYIEAVQVAQAQAQASMSEPEWESEWFVVRFAGGDWGVLSRRTVETVERIHRASGKVPVWTVEGPFYAEAV